MSERSAVQNPMLRYAQDSDWEYVPPDDALRLRGGESGMYFTPTLERQLLRLNPDIVDAARCADILRQLNLLKPNIERQPRRARMDARRAFRFCPRRESRAQCHAD